MLFPLALALLTAATPAPAPVRYDPETRTGFVGAAEVREAFGWTGRELASRAPGLVFQHDFWSADTYRVTCGERVVPVVHQREFGHFDLIDTAGYKGFRIGGARSGISGTSVPPAAGQPCPDDQRETIGKVRLVSSTTGWKLTVTSDQETRTLATW